MLQKESSYSSQNDWKENLFRYLLNYKLSRNEKNQFPERPKFSNTERWRRLLENEFPNVIPLKST